MHHSKPPLLSGSQRVKATRHSKAHKKRDKMDAGSTGGGTAQLSLFHKGSGLGGLGVGGPLLHVDSGCPEHPLEVAARWGHSTAESLPQKCMVQGGLGTLTKCSPILLRVAEGRAER
eukprot:CAMPEP_0173469764 /NCGR_PEP_ID=MMETSP1357-20121228/77531_1 /TAXON_ID=77926 /ORGANISM="Hemiselmis rufescens, Strain PCC563" /LENGTH=116 /DNA_ID=CAMNT_0014438015 /DNA_START=214 /DNA_END=564 /DNA_ORIENTATION=-